MSKIVKTNMLHGVQAGIVIVFRPRRFMMSVIIIMVLRLLIVVHTANIIFLKISDILKPVLYAHRNACKIIHYLKIKFLMI